MRVCINCFTENSDDAASCSECGMRLLIRAPGGGEAKKLKERATKPDGESRPQPKQPTSMFSIWVRAISRPVLATYEELLQQEPNPTLDKAVAWIGIAGLVAGAVSGSLSLLFGMAQGGSGGTPLTSWVVSVIRFPVILVISFVVSSAIMLVIARAVGGQGDLGSQSYLLAAAQAPVTVMSGSLATIPRVGVIAWLPLMYGIYLQVLALRAAHRFASKKAVGTLLWAGIVYGALYCICVFFLMALGLRESFG